MIADAGPERASHLTGFLVYQIYNALHGEPGVRGSGLINQTNLGPSQAYVQQVDSLVGQVAASAVNLVRSTGTQLPAKREDLRAKVDALKDRLAKTAPTD